MSEDQHVSWALPLHEPAQRRVIHRKKGSGTRMVGDKFFGPIKFHPHVRLELSSNEAVKESVAGGLGLGLISRHALHRLKKEHGVSVMDVKGFPLPWAWHIVHPSSKKLSLLAMAFKQHVLKEVTRRQWDLV